MLGDSGVGKSSLVLRWTQDTFAPSLTSTVGVNFKSKKVVLRGEAVQVQVWDTAGQEQFHKITTSFYKGAQGIMLVYDVTDPKSLENVAYWIKNIKAHASDSVQVALVGNKTDLRGAPSGDPSKRAVEQEAGREIAASFGVPFFETSAKESTNVNDGFTTLVAHIMDSMAPHKGFGVSGNGGSSGSSNGNSSSGGGERRSIVERASGEAKKSLFGGLLKKSNSFRPADKSSPTANGSNNSNSSVSGSNGSATASGDQGAAADEREDKEKCVVS